MAELTERKWAGEFIVSEAPNTRSRDKVTVKTGESLKAGHVLGLIKTAVAAAVSGNTGAGSVGSLTVGKRVKIGVYTLTCTALGTNAGVFEVKDPDGELLAPATVAVAYTSEHLNFTIADGSPDFAVGDAFTITVAADDYVEYDPTNTNGSQVPAGILYDKVDATAGDTVGVAVLRDAEVESAALEWFSGASSGQKTTALAEMAELLNIHGR